MWNPHQPRTNFAEWQNLESCCTLNVFRGFLLISLRLNMWILSLCPRKSYYKILDPDHHQNFNNCSLDHLQQLQKFSFHNFPSYPANTETNRAMRHPNITSIQLWVGEETIYTYFINISSVWPAPIKSLNAVMQTGNDAEVIFRNH